METSRTKVRAVMVRALCEKHGRDLSCSPYVLSSYPPKYVHYCTVSGCDYQLTLDQPHPFVSYEPEGLLAFAATLANALDLLGGEGQRDLANELQVSPSTLTRWATGEVEPHVKVQGVAIEAAHRILNRASRSA